VNFGDQENVLSVWITNVTSYREESSNTVFRESKDFNPNYGGSPECLAACDGEGIRNPAAAGWLGRWGVHLPSDLNIAGKTATVNIESPIKNETAAPAAVQLLGLVVDNAGNVRTEMRSQLKRSLPDRRDDQGGGKIDGARFGARMIRIYMTSIRCVHGDKIVDVNKHTTGFRKAEFKGGAGTGGVYINDKFTYLKGYAIRSTNEWAAVVGRIRGG